MRDGWAINRPVQDNAIEQDEEKKMCDDDGNVDVYGCFDRFGSRSELISSPTHFVAASRPIQTFPYLVQVWNLV